MKILSKQTASSRIFKRAFVLGLGALLAGCAGLLGGELLREGVPSGTLRIINGSGTTVTQVLISQCDASSYGLNRMPSGMVLRPGAAWDVTVSIGCYDLMIGYGTATGYAAARQKVRVDAGRVTSFQATGR
jgi:hypothetical protein